MQRRRLLALPGLQAVVEPGRSVSHELDRPTILGDRGTSPDRPPIAARYLGPVQRQEGTGELEGVWLWSKSTALLPQSDQAGGSQLFVGLSEDIEEPRSLKSLPTTASRVFSEDPKIWPQAIHRHAAINCGDIDPPSIELSRSAKSNRSHHYPDCDANGFRFAWMCHAIKRSSNGTAFGGIELAHIIDHVHQLVRQTNSFGSLLTSWTWRAVLSGVVGTARR